MKRLLGAVLSAALIGAPGAFAAEKTLTVGYSDALTGGGAVYGVPQKKAIDLAIEEINGAGGKAIGVSVDVGDSASVGTAIDAIKKEFGADVGVAAAIFNAAGGFLRKPFLELTEAEFAAGHRTSV